MRCFTRQEKRWVMGLVGGVAFLYGYDMAAYRINERNRLREWQSKQHDRPRIPPATYRFGAYAAVTLISPPVAVACLIGEAVYQVQNKQTETPTNPKEDNEQSTKALEKVDPLRLVSSSIWPKMWW